MRHLSRDSTRLAGSSSANRRDASTDLSGNRQAKGVSAQARAGDPRYVPAFLAMHSLDLYDYKLPGVS